MLYDLFNDVSPASTLRSQAATAAVNGVAVSLAGYESADVVIDIGNFTGTTPSATVQIQESTDGTSGWTAVAAGDLMGGALPTAFDTTNHNTLYERGYRGNQNFLRVSVSAISGTTPSLPISGLIVRGHPRSKPA